MDWGYWRLVLAAFLGTLIGRILSDFFEKLLTKKKETMTVKQLKELLDRLDENQEVRFADYEDDEDEVVQFMPIHGVELIKHKNKKMVCIFYNPDDDGVEKNRPAQTMSLN